MRTHRRAGFTLIELLIVVTVLGVLFAVYFTSSRRTDFEHEPLQEPTARVEQVAPGTFVITSPPRFDRDMAVISRLRELGCSDIRPIASQHGMLTGAVVRCEVAEETR